MVISHFGLWVKRFAKDDQDDFAHKTRHNSRFDGHSIFDDDDVYESRRFSRKEYWDDEYDEDEYDDPEDLEDY